MKRTGKTSFNVIMTAAPKDVEEGKRIFNSHANWMNKTHHKDGNKALLWYDVSTAREMNNPMDPDAGYTGNTQFCLYEVYESPAGLQDHWEQANESWDDFEALTNWLGKVDMRMVNGGTIDHYLW